MPHNRLVAWIARDEREFLAAFVAEAVRRAPAIMRKKDRRPVDIGRWHICERCGASFRGVSPSNSNRFCSRECFSATRLQGRAPSHGARLGHR